MVAGEPPVAAAPQDPDAEARQALERRRRTRNWALFAVLLGFVVLVYFVAIVRMSGG